MFNWLVNEAITRQVSTAVYSGLFANINIAGNKLIESQTIEIKNKKFHAKLRNM